VPEIVIITFEVLKGRLFYLLYFPFSIQLINTREYRFHIFISTCLLQFLKIDQAFSRNFENAKTLEFYLYCSLHESFNSLLAI
jgi:hypothetical protein